MGEESILKQINALYGMPVKALKERYRTILPNASPPPANKDFLVRKIAYKLQEDVFGGLSARAESQLEILKKELDPLKDLGRRPANTVGPKATRRLPMPGTIITKTYKGTLIQVKVLHKGFEFKGKPYRSLTAIAREISGVHQSGFVFFGLS